jgi:hypothetical protein
MTKDERTVATGSMNAELRRTLASPQVDASDWNRSFLVGVVAEALAGRTDRIRAAAIAIEGEAPDLAALLLVGPRRPAYRCRNEPRSGRAPSTN